MSNLSITIGCDSHFCNRVVAFRSKIDEGGHSIGGCSAKIKQYKKTKIKSQALFQKFSPHKTEILDPFPSRGSQSSIIYTHLTTATKSSSMSNAPKANSSSCFLAAKPLFRQGKQRLSTDTHGTWLPQAAHRKRRGAARRRKARPRAVIFSALVVETRGRPLFTTLCIFFA